MIKHIAIIAAIAMCLRATAHSQNITSSQSEVELEKRATAAIKINPKDGTAYNSRGLAYLGMKRYESAIADFTSAIVLLKGKEKANGYVNRGVAYKSLREYELARADFDQALNIHPRSLGAYHGRAGVWILKGEYERAKSDYGRAIQLAPNDARPFRLRALTHTLLGDFTQALADIERAVAIGENVWYSISMRGRIKALLHDEDGARSDFIESSNGAALDPGVRSNSCDGYTIIGALVEALAECNEVIRLQPHAGSSYGSRGLVYLKNEQLDLAKRDLDKALELSASNVLSHYCRALVAKHEGDANLKQKHLDQVLQIDPRAPARYAADYGLEQLY